MIVQETKELEKMKRKYTIDMNKIGDVVVKALESHYDKGLNADGSRMKPLKPATIAQKKKLGSRTASKPLIRTGQLRKSNFRITIGRNKVEVSVRDNIRSGGVTNNQILDFQTKMDRTPFGESDLTNKAVDNYLDKVLGG